MCGGIVGDNQNARIRLLSFFPMSFFSSLFPGKKEGDNGRFDRSAISLDNFIICMKLL